MKKLIISCALLSVMSCNNTGSQPDSTPGNTPVKNSPPAAAEGGCDQLVLFRAGVEIDAVSYDQAGAEVSKQHTKILSVSQEGGFTVAKVEGQDTRTGGDQKITRLNYEYKCDGENIYFDPASLFRTAGNETGATFESSLIAYPIAVTEGDVLPDATGFMSSTRNGRKMLMKYTYSERKVEGKEAITTPAGTWNCYKVSTAVNVEVDFPGMDEKAKDMMKKMQRNMKTTTITWWSPDFGIARMEMYMNGELKSRNEVVSVKK